jgi:hypothetical protein
MNSLFGCQHRRTTFPQRPGGKTGEAYVACVDCGKRFTYDWEQMRIGKPVDMPVLLPEEDAFPSPVKSKVRVLLWAAVPVIWLMNKIFKSGKDTHQLKD